MFAGGKGGTTPFIYRFCIARQGRGQLRQFSRGALTGMFTPGLSGIERSFLKREFATG